MQEILIDESLNLAWYLVDNTEYIHGILKKLFSKNFITRLPHRKSPYSGLFMQHWIIIKFQMHQTLMTRCENLYCFPK